MRLAKNDAAERFAFVERLSKITYGGQNAEADRELDTVQISPESVRSSEKR
jgi:hypothetical protein